MLIELTEVTRGSILVNTDQIRYVRDADPNVKGNSIIYFDKEWSLYVEESQPAIRALWTE